MPPPNRPTSSTCPSRTDAGPSTPPRTETSPPRRPPARTLPCPAVPRARYRSRSTGRPAGAVGTLPVVLYTHGAGWVFGDAHTHDRLVRELTTRAEAGRAGVPQARQPGSPVLPGPHPPRAQGRAPLDVRSRLRWPDRRRAYGTACPGHPYLGLPEHP